jgi:hypothetical protein
LCVEQAFAQHALADHSGCSEQDHVHTVCALPNPVDSGTLVSIAPEVKA